MADQTPQPDYTPNTSPNSVNLSRLLQQLQAAQSSPSPALQLALLLHPPNPTVCGLSPSPSVPTLLSNSSPASSTHLLSHFLNPRALSIPSLPKHLITPTPVPTDVSQIIQALQNPASMSTNRPVSPSPEVESAPTSKTKKRGGGRPRKATKKMSTDTGPSGARKPQQSWVKDENSEGQTAVDVIVEWLCLNIGDKESERDEEWMCMEDDDEESTNYSVFRSAALSKKECTDRCAKYLAHKGFPGRDGKGCKQQIESLEAKFRDAEGWRNRTGQGIMDEANAQVAMRRSENADDETIDLITAEAARSTKAAIEDRCKHYDSLAPIMGSRLCNQPLDTAETGPPQLKPDTPVPASPLTAPALLPDMDEPSARISELSEGDADIDVTKSGLVLERLSEIQGLDVGSFSLLTAKVLNLPKVCKSNSTKRRPPASIPDIEDDTNKKPSLRENSVTQMMRSALPDKSFHEESARQNKRFNLTQEKLANQLADSTTGLMRLLESRLGGPLETGTSVTPAYRMQRDKEDDEAREQEAKRRRLEIERVELDIQERTLQLEDRKETQKKKKEAGSRVEALALVKEKAAMIAQFVSAGMTREAACEETEQLFSSL